MLQRAYEGQRTILWSQSSSPAITWVLRTEHGYQACVAHTYLLSHLFSPCHIY